MIYCSLDPGLLVMEGLESYEIGKARSVINSLIVHSRKMEECRARIPMTQAFIQAVHTALDNIPFDNPPIRKPLRERIVEMLAKAAHPPVSPAEAVVTILSPDVSSSWITPEIRSLWLDCLAASLFEKLSDQQSELVISTWPRDGLPFTARLASPDVYHTLELPEGELEVPVLKNEQDWDEYLCALQGWPAGLENRLIEAYARRNLGIAQEQVKNRLTVEFTRPCYREVSREADPEIREMIIDTIACRAYNCLRKDHHDEPIEGSDERRVRVKKMTPPVRLHYLLENSTATFTLYSNGDHDKGLP